MGAGALAALIGVGSVNMVYRSGLLLSEAGRWAKLDPAEARRRSFGRAYTDAIDAIRRALPDDSWYLVVSPEPSDASGWALWVRYDLAPRRPVLILPRVGRGFRAANGGGVPKWVRWAVLPDGHGVPILLTREEALSRLRDHGLR